MAVQHISMGQTPHATRIRAALSQLKNGLDDLNDIFKCMELMKDGGVFTDYAMDKFGTPDVETVQAGFDELASLQAKLNTDAEVTFINAALLQAYRKFLG